MGLIAALEEEGNGPNRRRVVHQSCGERHRAKLVGAYEIASPQVKVIFELPDWQSADQPVAPL
ncbi:MAG: hypothetical protein AAFP90_18895 [Planctomycetota bacterium]